MGNSELGHHIVVLGMELVTQVHAASEDLWGISFCNYRWGVQDGSAISAHERIFVSKDLEAVKDHVALSDAFFSENLEEHDCVPEREDL